MGFRPLCFLILGMEVCQIPDRNMGVRTGLCLPGHAAPFMP